MTQSFIYLFILFFFCLSTNPVPNFSSGLVGKLRRCVSLAISVYVMKGYSHKVTYFLSLLNSLLYYTKDSTASCVKSVL